MKKLCALLSNVKNEEVILPLWLSYYTRFFAPSDIYISDDSSTDTTVSILETAGVVIDTVSASLNASLSGSSHHQHLVDHNKDKVSELLQTYETVLFVEGDEFVVPVSGTLKEFLDGWALGAQNCQRCKIEKLENSDAQHKCFFHRVQTFTNLEIIQDVDNEPDLILTQPIMAQRAHALNVPKFDNPQLWGVRPSWSSGYHGINGHKIPSDRTLWLVHLHHVDFKLCNERHKSRKKIVDNVFFAVEEDDELMTYFRTKLNTPTMFYNGPIVMEIPPEVKIAF